MWVVQENIQNEDEKENMTNEEQEAEDKIKELNEKLRQESIQKYGYDPENDGCWECGRKGYCGCWG